MQQEQKFGKREGAEPSDAGRAHRTPLEAGHFARLPKNREVIRFLRRLDRDSPLVSVSGLGRSAGGRNIVGVRTGALGTSAARAGVKKHRLRVLIIGSQHGREASGTEALQMLVREIAEGRMTKLLHGMELMIIPCANPDGRDLERQTNGARVNLNSDYVLLSQPESRLIANAIDDFRPNVLLDVHESACFKRRTLAREGFLTDFEAQFDSVSHPAVDIGLRRLGLGRLLPKIIAAVTRKGLHAQRYVGEISSVKEVISHGSLSAGKLRNYAGLRGVLPVLLENRLDRSDLTFPTPRNIGVRSGKQYLSILTFLEVCASESERIIKATRAATGNLTEGGGKFRLPLDFQYVAEPGKPKIQLPYRSLRGGRRVMKTHTYRGRVTVARSVRLPKALAVTRHQKMIAKILDLHGIRYAVLKHRLSAKVVELRLGDGRLRKAADGEGQEHPPVIAERSATLTFSPGDLWVDLAQRKGRIAALIFDPRSQDSIFLKARYRELLEGGEQTFVLPVTKEL